MKRRLNYTGRIRIPQEKVSVVVTSTADSCEECRVMFDSGGINVRADSRVYAEAYSRGDQIRFDLGTFSEPATHKAYPLTHLSNLHSVRFRLLVVDCSKSGGRILAAADGIKPSRPDTSDHDMRSILPVDFRDLGQEVWRLRFADDEVTLLLNRRIPDVRQMAAANDVFRLTVFPAALREITLRLCSGEGAAPTGDHTAADEEDDWRATWRRFLSNLVGSDRLRSAESGTVDDIWEFAETAANTLADGLTKEFGRLLRLQEIDS